MRMPCQTSRTGAPRRYFMLRDGECGEARGGMGPGGECFEAFFAQSLRDYLGGVPHLPSIGIGDHGKPYFTDPALSGVHFSVTGTDGCKAVCFAPSEVGFDIEDSRRSIAPGRVAPLAARWLSGDERAYVEDGAAGKDPFLPDCPPVGARERFLLVWTRKEAFVKWTGRGIGYGMRSFSTMGNARMESGCFEDTYGDKAGNPCSGNARMESGRFGGTYIWSVCTGI